LPLALETCLTSTVIHYTHADFSLPAELRRCLVSQWLMRLWIQTRWHVGWRRELKIWSYSWRRNLKWCV